MHDNSLFARTFFMFLSCSFLGRLFARPPPLPMHDTFVSQLGAVDATQASSLAQKYGVQGYPTIKTFPAGSKKGGPQDYNGPREAAGIVDFATGVRESAGCCRALVQDANRGIGGGGGTRRHGR